MPVEFTASTESRNDSNSSSFWSRHQSPRGFRELPLAAAYRFRYHRGVRGRQCRVEAAAKPTALFSDAAASSRGAGRHLSP